MDGESNRRTRGMLREELDERMVEIDLRAVEGGDDVVLPEAGLRRGTAGLDRRSVGVTGDPGARRHGETGHGRESFFPASACTVSGRATLMGIAKPIPWAVGSIAVSIPMTAPLASMS